MLIYLSDIATVMLHNNYCETQSLKLKLFLPQMSRLTGDCWSGSHLAGLAGLASVSKVCWLVDRGWLDCRGLCCDDKLLL